jgi:uncharacterized protein YndB with AHSA1/START domain
MANKTESIKFEQQVNASPAEIYTAFINATGLCEWLCNVAQADARPNGRLYLWWSSGYYACGEYTSLREMGKAGSGSTSTGGTSLAKVVFSWYGRGEPGVTRVKVTLQPGEVGTLVRLEHTDLGEGKAWTKTRKQLKRGWKESLENLKSVMETGVDLRLARQPMIGVTGVEEVKPAETSPGGLRVQGVVEGMGAAEAGLQRDDMIIKLGGERITNYISLVNVLKESRAGNEVKVVFYRGGEKQNLKLRLSQRPLPDVPATTEELVKAAQKIYTELNNELKEGLQGATDADALYRQTSEEWSAREILAHLIATERETHSWMAGLIEGQEADFIFHANQTTRIAATASAYPTLTSLLSELKRNQAETVAMLAALPPELTRRKGSYWRLGQTILQTPYHYKDHTEQIKATIAEAKKGTT